MKIYTSYFGNLKKLGAQKIVPIGVALYTPKWYQGPELKVLAPKGYMLAKDVTEQQYIQMYTSQVLARLNPRAILQLIEQVSGGRDCALLCYEKPGDFCHRRLIAEWLQKTIGIQVDEFIVAEEPQKPKMVQMTLF